ncbi:MAG: integrase [Isosphaera sp.]|nr:integrase [Isosphaera sp.]
MSNDGHKTVPRKADVQLLWVTRDLGPQWETWRRYAAEWMTTQHVGVGQRLGALRAFFEEYLHALQLSTEPAWLLRRKNHVPDFYETACPKSMEGLRYSNYIRAFLHWVLQHYFSKPDDHGQPILLTDYHNPVPWRSMREFGRPSESVHSPLPYRFIREMSEIIAPGQHFCDWHWAQEAIVWIARGKESFGDWLPADKQHIDTNDPDCVWRPTRRKGREVLELWSPARAVALLVKLTLPLRTYQVRMLDSGESDTWRYTSSGWEMNHGPLASGNQRRPVQHGVFRRIEDRETGTTLSGLYVNTNKTAESCKEGEELGYVIPWQHDRLLYWLEKLRNWQEKYNPITRTTAWTELEIKHLEHAKSAKQLARMPDACFLFRDAAASGKDNVKPLRSSAVQHLWYKLLGELQRRCSARGEKLANGMPLQFIQPDRYSTLFPLHSLRVSLLTSLALDAEVPLVVLSKLVAGHSRLMMTLYYTKPSIARMTQALNAASDKLDASASHSLQRFLAEATYDQIAGGAVFNGLDNVKAAIPDSAADRNPVGWMSRHHGMCLVGGNVSPSEGNSRIGGCYNGGPLLKKHYKPNQNIYDAVPGGPGNCVRCRWFVTEPRYIDALRAHFNNVSYHLAEAAKEAKAHEESMDRLKVRRYAAEQAQQVFAEQADYLKTERLWESSLVKVDQLANDLTATYRLIRRCMALIERDRENARDTQQLVAAGALQDLQMAFEDTQSELLHLAGVCLDAELYPDESPGKAIVRRSQFLDSALYREGLQPIFLSLSEAEQLRLGNRFMRHLAAMVRPENPDLGLRRVVDTLEAGRSLEEIGIIDDMINMLETELRAPLMRVSDITQAPRKRRIPELVK